MKGKGRKLSDAEKHGYVLDEELISTYAREYEIEPQRARRVIESVFEMARSMLIKNSVLNIRGFGFFYIKTRKSCRYKNNWTGQVENVDMVRVVRYVPARSIKMSINQKAKDEFMRYMNKQQVIKKEMRLAGIKLDNNN